LPLLRRRVGYDGSRARTLVNQEMSGRKCEAGKLSCCSVVSQFGLLFSELAVEKSF
jgi:hypothetical protein